MTPDQFAKSNTESAHQTAFFAWCSVAANAGFDVANRWAEDGHLPVVKFADPVIPELKWIHHIPNGGLRGGDKRSRTISGGKMKAEGVRPGILDVFLPVPCSGYHGLYIEFKKPSAKAVKATSKGGLTDEQIKFIDHCKKHNYAVVVVYNWRDAAKMVCDYLSFSLHE